MKVITVANLKGGSAKTTSTAFLVHALAARGKKMLVIDADPQGQALRWSENAEWNIPTLSLPVKDLHKRVRGIVPHDTDIVVIDTPPLEEQAGIVYSALRAADVVLITMAPTMSELDRLPDVWEAVEEISPLVDHEPFVSVLLNRTVTNASSTGEIRKAIVEHGKDVLDSMISRREHYAQAYNAPIQGTWQYDDVADELMRKAALSWQIDSQGESTLLRPTGKRQRPAPSQPLPPRSQTAQCEQSLCA